MHAPTEDVAALTARQLDGLADELRDLADKLEAFCGGDLEAWTPETTLFGHSMMTVIQSGTSVLRTFHTDRARKVIRLDDRR